MTHAPSFPDAGAAGDVTAGLPGFRFVDHIAIAVPRGTLDAHVAAYAGMGLAEIHRETLEGPDRVTESLLRIGEGPNLIQLLEPLDDASPVNKAIDRNGGKAGLHHIGLRVRDIHAAFDHLRARGFRILDEAPRPGSRGTTVFFLHPKGHPDVALGVLIEVVQE